MLGGAIPSFGSGDILYGNDMTKWRRFANSLRMRLAMRMSEVSPGAAQSAFAAAYAAGGFQSNADNAMLQWVGAPYQNPLFENWHRMCRLRSCPRAPFQEYPGGKKRRRGCESHTAVIWEPSSEVTSLLWYVSWRLEDRQKRPGSGSGTGLLACGGNHR